MSQNLPPLEDLPLERFSNFIWWWATKGASSQTEVEKFKALVWRPPPGEIATKGPWSPESETKAFAALRAQLGR